MLQTYLLRRNTEHPGCSQEDSLLTLTWETGYLRHRLRGRIAVYVANPRSVKDLRFPVKMYLPAPMIAELENSFGEENVSLVPGRAPL